MTERVGRYEIIDEIGRGGFAIVHHARDTQLGRDVALKELRPVLLNDDGWVQRFRREAQAIARLDHPRIVPIYDVFEAEQRLFLVMRLVNGPGLDQLISSRAQVPWAEALDIISAIAEGLDYAHSRNILHRDLKPANILIDIDRGPMLTDFGLAKLIGDTGASLSASGTVVGTPHYIAPEVWEGKGSTAQADIYALGCVLFEMLTGGKLFAGETSPVVMLAHFQPHNLPAEWPPGVPPGVSDVLEKALAKNPADRHPTAGKMAAALRALPLEAQPRVTVQPAAESRPPHPGSPPPVPADDSLAAVRERLRQPEPAADSAPHFADMDDDEDEEEDVTWSQFLAHLGPYVAVNGGLAFINLMTSPDFLWFLIPTIFWGIGIAFHLRNVLFGRRMAQMAVNWRKFADHASAYMIVMGALFLFNLLVSPDFLWAFFPAFGWGIGLVSHFFATLANKDGDEDAVNDGSRRQSRREALAARRQARWASRRERWGGAPAAPPAAELKPAKESSLQAHLRKAREYRQQIDGLVKSSPNRHIETQLQDLATQVDDWNEAIERLAKQVDAFERNTLIQHDLETVPQAIAKLEAQLAAETDAATRADLERTLANRRKQWDTLRQLQNTMKRAEIKIENTLSLLGTLYPQILTSQSTNQVADYSRITSEVSEEVRLLQDHLEALEEVKFGETGAD